jgi:prepilin-type N-terminal cleavage/methylation domain-containing protein
MTRLNDAGFTIVELIIVTIVSGILFASVSGFALNYWGKTISLSNNSQTLVSRLNAGDYLRNSVDSASGLIIQNDLADPHVGKADPSDVTGTHWVVIHAIPGTISMGASGSATPVIYYDRPSVDTSKNIIMNGTIPYEDDIILYLDGTTKQLLARTVVNAATTTNRSRTTCPKVIATTGCPADIVVADNVSSLSMRYFSRSGNTIDYTSITDPITGSYIGPDFQSVEIVEFTINLTKKAQFHNATDTSNQTVVRVALRN